MAGGGYRGILAAVPPAQYLRSASGKGASRSRSKAKATATATAGQQLREQAPSHIQQIGVQLLLFTTHQAER
jgi:hypothetical protein